MKSWSKSENFIRRHSSRNLESNSCFAVVALIVLELELSCHIVARNDESLRQTLLQASIVAALPGACCFSTLQPATATATPQCWLCV